MFIPVHAINHIGATVIYSLRAKKISFIYRTLRPTGAVRKGDKNRLKGLLFLIAVAARLVEVFIGVK
jgi:hypothetical protein